MLIKKPGFASLLCRYAQPPLDSLFLRAREHAVMPCSVFHVSH